MTVYVSIFTWDWSEFLGQIPTMLIHDRIALDERCKEIALTVIGTRDIKDVHILVHDQPVYDIDELRAAAQAQHASVGPDIIGQANSDGHVTGRRIRNSSPVTFPPKNGHAGYP